MMRYQINRLQGIDQDRPGNLRRIAHSENRPTQGHRVGFFGLTLCTHPSATRPGCCVNQFQFRFGNDVAGACGRTHLTPQAQPTRACLAHQVRNSETESIRRRTECNMIPGGQRGRSIDQLQQSFVIHGAIVQRQKESPPPGKQRPGCQLRHSLVMHARGFDEFWPARSLPQLSWHNYQIPPRRKRPSCGLTTLSH